MFKLEVYPISFTAREVPLLQRAVDAFNRSQSQFGAEIRPDALWPEFKYEVVWDRLLKCAPADTNAVFVTSLPISDNWFSHTKDTTSVISTKDWVQVYAPPNLDSYLLLELALAAFIQSCGVDELALDPHDEDTGCFFDLCGHKPSMRWKMKCGFICGHHRELYRRFGGDSTSLSAIENIVESVRLLAIRGEVPAHGNAAPHIPEYDVFLSYATGDAGVAEELRSDLEQAGCRCFMAEKDVVVAAEWQETIRTSLLGSKRVLVLLTPRSVDRPWVLLETGAAWALGKPLVPALIHVAADKLVDPLRRRQARVVETTAQRRSLVTELAESRADLSKLSQ